MEKKREHVCFPPNSRMWPHMFDLDLSSRCEANPHAWLPLTLVYFAYTGALCVI